MAGCSPKRHGLAVEQLNQLGKVGERAGQTIDLIDNDDVDLSGLDVIQQALKGRAVEA